VSRCGFSPPEHAAIARERVCLVGIPGEKPAAFEQTGHATRDRSDAALEPVPLLPGIAQVCGAAIGP
jgi:hypothetical protein